MAEIIIQENIDLSKFTTFHIGGLARYFVIVSNLEELTQSIGFSKDKGVPFWILGGGSNVLISDSGFPGLVIKNEIKKKEISTDGRTLTFGSGEIWDEAVKFSIDNDFSGLENLSGIPGTVGAAPVQNIGAYGSEVKDTIFEVRALDSETNEEKVFSNEQCQFGYRTSIFKKPEYKKYIITEVSFLLEKYNKKEGGLNISYKDLKNYFALHSDLEINLQNLRAAVLEIRKGKFPDLKQFGLAGSFYKNPIITVDKYNELVSIYKELPSFRAGDGLVKIPIAWILDNVLHLKGYKFGNAGVHKDHALALVNLGGASAKEIFDLSFEIKKRVKEKTGIDLEEEVETIK